MKQVRINLAQNKKAPESLNLRYSRTHLDFAVFYDLNGHEIYYKYRQDRFDRRAQKKLASLIPGQSYKVIGPYLGVWFGNSLVVPSNTRHSEALKNDNAQLVFGFKHAIALRLNEILL